MGEMHPCFFIYKVLRKYLNQNPIKCEQFGNSRFRD